MADRYQIHEVSGQRGGVQVIQPEDGTTGAGRASSGVCHRCGWRGPVAKVGRADRKRLHTGRTFGRLCDDCVNDLLHQQDGSVNQRKPARLRSVRHRDVA